MVKENTRRILAPAFDAVRRRSDITAAVHAHALSRYYDTTTMRALPTAVGAKQDDAPTDHSQQRPKHESGQWAASVSAKQRADQASQNDAC